MFFSEIQTIYLRASRPCELVSANLLFTKLNWDLAAKHWAISPLLFFFLPTTFPVPTSGGPEVHMLQLHPDPDQRSKCWLCTDQIQAILGLESRAEIKREAALLGKCLMASADVTDSQGLEMKFRLTQAGQESTTTQQGENYHTSALTSVYGQNMRVCWAQTSLEETEWATLEMLDLFYSCQEFVLE